MDKLATIELDEYQKEELENIPTFDVDDILGRANTARLVFGSQVYFLRRTRQNKLLLTK
ncbi:hemin uptake protein HemP [Amylibacter sp. SFDW26]|uniref:hemin uptake protein HemP n=1 Tax=Amylibacter sp. SFDW26 TaxID=2652722 RepID=UPI00186A1E01|nr:hemin uptake protein HemP [Amylibacter sp. SFDW26]